ncbi:MAG: hypothetical protein CMI63_08580 [Parvularcula sp.]|nr:hypothetical protein [Parvularcula sp.]
MYEQFFGLAEKPFSIQPDPSFLYWGRTHRLAYAMLEYGVLNHAGISVITGEVGCGKTTLIHRLLDQLSDTHTVALLSNVQEGRGDLLSWLLMAFGQPFEGSGHVARFSQLQQFFISEYAQGRRIVLIIDEAQNLSTDMLEELRLLSNINAGKDQLLQLILVGQPELKDVLNRPELVQLTQRVGSDFHLTPLSREEVHSYIETRLSIAGCRRRIFTERAIDLIAEQSRGVPRVINVIADTALVYAFSAEDLVVGVETIRNVIRDKKSYGVFGIASQEPSAPPIAAADDDDDDEGPEAFEKESGLVDRQPSAHRRNERRTERPVSPEEDYAPDIPVKTLADVRAEVTTRTMPRAEEAEIRLAERPAEQPAQPEPAPAPEPAVHNAASAAAQKAAIGVVIIGADPRVSPEAAIRSVPEGCSVVFAPLGPMNEAVAAARKAGAEIAEAGKGPQTAGRAKNAGYRHLKKIMPGMRYVQFMDASSALDPDWFASAEKFMERRPEVAVIEGSTRRRNGDHVSFPTVAEQRKYQTPGEIVAVAAPGAFMRTEAFEAAGGFRGDLLSCEDDDLCIRQRRRGAHIWRLETDMMIREPRKMGWWKRAVLRGFDNAYAMSLHGGPPERHGVGETVRAVIWGFFIPFAIIVAAGLAAAAAAMLAPLTPAPVAAAAVLALGALLYALKILASIIRRGPFRIASWGEAFGAIFGRFAEAMGVFRFWFGGDRPARA